MKITACKNTKIEQKKQVNLYKKIMPTAARFLYGSCLLSVKRPHIAARYARRVVRGFRGLLTSTKVCPFSCTKKNKRKYKKTPISV